MPDDDMNDMYMALASKIWAEDAKRIFLCFTAGRGFHIDWYEGERQLTSRNIDPKLLDRFSVIGGDLGLKVNDAAGDALKRAWPSFRIKATGKPISG